MTVDDDNQGLAAEYVLGTLDETERAQAEALMMIDAGFASLVKEWERRLGELHAMVAPVSAPPELLAKIKARLQGAEPGAPLHLPPLVEEKSAPAVIPVHRTGLAVDAGSRGWRKVAALTSVLALALAAFVALQEFRPDLLPMKLQRRVMAQAGQLIAVLQGEKGAPGFVLTLNVDARRYTLRRAGAEKPNNQSYELWIGSDRFAQPRSLGVIGDDEFTTRANLRAFDPQVIKGATYTVSVEPPGGSPTGQPTGPVIYSGRLVETGPAPKPAPPPAPLPPQPDL